jgi:hypothetical protein
MESHKRILGILYIISGALLIIAMIFLSALFSVFLPVILEHSNADDQWILEWIVPFIQLIAVIIVLLFAIPSLIAGWGLLNKQKWALTLALILGCFKLFNFPIGTALGIYTIWVYAEDNRQNKPA